LVLGGLAWSGPAASAAEVLRLSQDIPGDSKPIVLHADTIITWTEGSQRIILLKGTVLVAQGVVQVRMQEGLAWIDMDRKRQAGILHLNLFAQGEVHVENGAESRKGSRAFVELNTRGELKLKSQRTKIVQQPLPDDPLYRRGLTEVAAAGLPGPQQTVQRASAVVPAPERPATKPARLLPPTNGVAGPLGEQPNAPSNTQGAVPRPLTPPSSPAGPSSGPRSSADPATGPIQRIAYFEFPTEWVHPLPAQAPSPPAQEPLPALVVPPASGSPSPAPAPGSPATGPGTIAPVPVAPPANTPVAPGPAPPGRPPTNAPGPHPPPAPTFRQLRIVPRTSSPLNWETKQLDGEQALLVTGGAILSIQGTGRVPSLIDIEADRIIVWSKGSFQEVFGGLRSPDGVKTREIEFYLAGNVIIREQQLKENRTLRADEVYYDVARDVAVARNADVEFPQPGVPDPVHFRADEILKLSANEFKGYRAEIFSSRLPSDPGLKVYVKEATFETKVVPKVSLFGIQYINRLTGQPEVETQRLIRSENVFLEVEDVPIFYLPFLQGDVNDPLGPLQSVNAKYDRIFGFQLLTTFNVYDLIGIDPFPGTRWKMDVDYLTSRGPALGSEFEYSGNSCLGIPGKNVGLVRAYGINDTGTDILGGGRGPLDNHPEWRGRFLWRHSQELADDFTFQAQISALSDTNFLEQYYKPEFDMERNQDTFAYLKQQRTNWAWTVLGESRLFDWVTKTEWLPRADGYLIGQSLLERLSYNVHASAGYARLMPTTVPPPPTEITDMADNTGRFDLAQEISFPFSLGALRVVPYGVLDLTYYTQDLTGQDRGRVYGGGGVRTSLPLTRLYPDVQSDLFNLNGINHKIVLSANYFVARTDTSFLRLPQLDRLNDDATDQALRDITPLQPIYLPGGTGLALQHSPVFNTQVYAIRRLLDSATDTLDNIEELQLDLRQRWQTKRGYPGNQHIVDFMTLDLSATYFPHDERDNFGSDWAFLQYDWTWNIGDRTALVSTGLVDPVPNGARIFTFGAYLNRPDRTNFYVGFRETDPLNSQLAIGSINYIFSPKYAMTASIMYDFGNHIQANSLILTRMGSDLQVSIGVNYNSTLNTVGATLEIFPNLIPENRRTHAALGSGMFGRQ
jgi:hypothetical protein